MKTTSLALTDSRMRLATVVLPEPVPPEMPIIMLIEILAAVVQDTQIDLSCDREILLNSLINGPITRRSSSVNVSRTRSPVAITSS
jgi:hypothetical protein